MARMTHNKKKQLARRLITPQEIKEGVSPFNSRAWLARSESRKNKKQSVVTTGFARPEKKLSLFRRILNFFL